MTSQKTPNQQPPVAGSRRDTMRKQRLAEQRTARRRVVAVRAGIAITAVVLVVAAVAGIASSIRSSSSTTSITGVVATGITAQAPTAADASGAIVLGDTSAPTTVTIFTDFNCPWCGEFDRSNGDVLNAAVSAGKVKLQIHQLAFLDGSTKYSTRAASAFATVADADPSAALAFYQLLYANQPEESSSGLTDQQLADYAVQAGVTKEVAATLSTHQYESWVAQTTDFWHPSRISGTPTIFINGERFEDDPYHAGPFGTALDAAIQG